MSKIHKTRRLFGGMTITSYQDYDFSKVTFDQQLSEYSDLKAKEMIENNIR